MLYYDGNTLGNHSRKESAEKVRLDYEKGRAAELKAEKRKKVKVVVLIAMLFAVIVIALYVLHGILERNLLAWAALVMISGGIVFSIGIKESIMGR